MMEHVKNPDWLDWEGTCGSYRPSSQPHILVYEVDWQSEDGRWCKCSKPVDMHDLYNKDPFTLAQELKIYFNEEIEKSGLGVKKGE
jgi:hypothetical protein